MERNIFKLDHMQISIIIMWSNFENKLHLLIANKNLNFLIHYMKGISDLPHNWKLKNIKEL